jgi:hypothetical protein
MTGREPRLAMLHLIDQPPGATMMRLKSGLGALALVALAACGGGSKNETTTPLPPEHGAGDPLAQPGDTAPLPAVPDQPAAEPASVIAVVSLGDPAGQLAQFAAFADAVQPGMGAMLNLNQFMPMLAGAVGAPGLDGYAVDKPMYVIALDPKASGGSALLVFGVGDPARLKGSVGGSAELMIHKGFAAVGSRGSLRAAAPWALSNLVSQAPPAELAMVVHMRRFMAGQGAEIEQMLRSSMGPSQRPEELKIAEGVFSVVQQVDRFEGLLAAGPAGLTASGWLVPVAQTKLEAFAATQQPTDYGFAARLPAGEWPMLYAARLDFGPFKSFFVEVAQAQGGPAAQVGQIFDMLGTEHAIALGMKNGAPRVAASIGLTDGKAVAALLDAAMKEMAKGGPQPWDSMLATIKAGSLKVKGGALHEVTFAPGADASPEEKKDHARMWARGMKLFVGVAGNALVAALDQDSKKTAQELAGNVGKAAKPRYGKHTSAAIAASVERKESALFLMDVALWAIIEKGKAEAKGDPKAGDLPPVSIGMGFEGGRVAGRFHLPIEQVKSLVRSGM